MKSKLNREKYNNKLKYNNKDYQCVDLPPL